MLTIEKLRIIFEVINITAVARLAGYKPGTIINKIRRNVELTVLESLKIEEILQKYGFVLDKAVITD